MDKTFEAPVSLIIWQILLALTVLFSLFVVYKLVKYFRERNLN